MHAITPTLTHASMSVHTHTRGRGNNGSSSRYRLEKTESQIHSFVPSFPAAKG